MKKLVFILCSLVLLTGCSVDDDSPQVTYELAEIVANDLPDEFELGETYEITVTYVLPTQCHSFFLLDAQRGGNEGEERRTIYVAAVASQAGTECSTTGTGDQGTTKFSIPIDEAEDFIFKFLIGENEGEAVYQTVVVPVVDGDGAPQTSQN